MKKFAPIHCFLLLAVLTCCAVPVPVGAQVQTLPLHDRSAWQIYNRSLQFNDKDSALLDAAPGDGLMLFKAEMTTPSVIELDIKGENKLNQSFVGVAFNVQDASTYEAIYFRPFNFFNPDTVRLPRSVQYVSMPAHPWEKLRAEHPGQYENRIVQVPDPNGWFHVKVEISLPVIKVYVNNDPQPVLVVKSLSTHKKGRIGFMVGNMSRGSFAHLAVAPAAAGKAAIPYGNNPAAGNYVQAGDARLYYEVYGQGEPVLLLHGGVYGYIDEFAGFIDELSRTHEVICLATRGHGKSYTGNTPFSWQQRAEDAYGLIRHLKKGRVAVLGFSDGAAAGYKLAALYPEVVTKLVAIGFGDRPKGGVRKRFDYTPQSLMAQAKALFTGRNKLMPEPERWGDCLNWLNRLYNDDHLSGETFGRIKCPVLVMSGDQDDYHTVDQVVRAAQQIRGSQLSIIPGCHHVVFFCNYAAVWESIRPFLERPAAGGS